MNLTIQQQQMAMIAMEHYLVELRYRVQCFENAILKGEFGYAEALESSMQRLDRAIAFHKELGGV